MNADRAPGTVAVLGSYAPSLVVFRGALIAELAGRGHRVLAMAPDIGEANRAALVAMGAEPLEVPISNSSLHPRSFVRSFKALSRVFRAERPEALIAYTVKPVTIGCLAGARTGIPHICALVTGLGFAFTEGTGAKRRLSRIVASLLYRLAFRKATSIIFQNPDDRDHFRGLGLLPAEANVTIVNGSGVDLAHFHQEPVPAGPRFLMISRLLGDKGVREYALAARRLKARHPEALFRLVGFFDPSPDGISEAELRALTDGSVEFLGRLDDVRPAIREASVYVLPSYREGTPRSVLEAMAMGRAIVTTDAPGCRQTVEEGVNGFLVPPRDARALEEAMERFIVRPELAAKMGEQSRRVAEEKFDVHSVNGAIIAAAGIDGL